jgi:hypothetical protein
MHDGESPQFFHTARQHLDHTFSEQWIEHGGPDNWPVLSPNLNALHLWLWGHLKSFVYSAPISNKQRKPVRICEWNQEFPAQCASLCDEEMELCWNTWEPPRHGACAVEIEKISSMSQQVLVSGRTLTGNFCSFNWKIRPLRVHNPLL